MRNQPAGAGADVQGSGGAAATACCLEGHAAVAHSSDRGCNLCRRISAIEPEVEPALIEQSLGEWQGLPHAELPARLTLPKHAFWPLAGHERPPGGETWSEVIDRVGEALERLAAQAS